MTKQIEALRQWVAESESIVFFGGAGVSTESGIPDFRSVDGLYHQKFQYPPETILSHSFYVRRKAEFYDFYRAKMLAPWAEPNAAHRKLAQWEQEGRLKAVITQNIDGLHQKAGSKTVYELHGSVERNHCLGRAHHFYSLSEIPARPVVPICPQCGAIVRPDVVLYGEALDTATVEASIDAINRADVLIVGGTSLAVYPAAGLLQYYPGRRLALINLTRTPMDSQADLVIHKPVDQIIGTVSDRLLHSGDPAAKGR